ncbi:MAG: hypothetical protein LBD43_01370 [Holosporales bacterium]|jgi:type VI secretion system protein ImpL|nr:hypothetical protein [Holosporales bacterium]
MNFFGQLISSIVSCIKDGGISLPMIICVVLAIAFIAMLLVTVFTLISLKRAEIKAKKVIDIPPSAMQDDTTNADEIPNDPDAGSPWPIGELINKYLIMRGYIRANGVVKSFFKALDFLRNSLGTGYKYKLPWYMMVGSNGSGKSSLMSGFTSNEIYNDDEEDSQCTWWFLKSGVILDIKGSVFMPDGGSDADEKSWNIIMDMLSRYRSAKPLNGIIFTISAEELYGKGKLSPEDLTKKAQFIARKLHFAQNYLCMKLPIYVVVTKTDVIPGFQSFCSEVPVRNRNNMLGWSSPYSIDVVYNPKVIDEGFSTLEGELNVIRMEILAESFTTTTRDGIFVFPSELLTIKHSLGIYIDSLFKSASVDERFYFRGFYFTGDSKMMPFLPSSSSGQPYETLATVGTPDADLNEVGNVSVSFKSELFTPKKIFFFDDLLMKKIFAEAGMASPMRSKVYRANKSIFIAKVSTAAFVAIGSYGLFNAHDVLQHDRNVLYPSLFKISSLIKNAGDLTYKNLQEDGNEILADCTNSLLMMMQQLNNMKLSSVFVPASWFSSINRVLTDTLRTSYQRVVVRTIYMNLVLKARKLLNMKPEARSSGIAHVLNPSNSAEYAQLKQYVFGLIELEKNIKKFDSLRTSGDPDDLNDLISYTFRGSLSAEFLSNYQELRRILMNTPFPPINLAPYKDVAYNTLITLFQSYIDAIFTTKSANSIISSLTGFVTKLTRQKLDKIPDCSKFISFSKDLTEVCKNLGEEGKTWLDKDVFEADNDYDSFLDGVEALFGKDVSQKLFDVTAVNFEHLKVKLFEFDEMLKRDATKPAVAVKKKLSAERVVPSSGIFTLERCLASLCAEPFMERPGDYRLITDIPEGKMIFWDDDLVQYAYDIGKRYEQFMATSIKEFPKALQEGVTLLAQSNMSSVIASTIAKSQSLVDAPTGITPEITSEEILQKQVTELKGVAHRIVNLLGILRSDKFAFVFGNLRSVLNVIGFTLLNHIDRLLKSQKPYIPADLTFKFWNGESGAGLAAFSSADTEELQLYIQLQRSIISRLALDFADPIVEFLNSDVVFDQNFGNHQQLVKWTRIVNSVKGLQKKDPSSSVAAIERFIMRLLNGYTIDDITSKIDIKSLAGESGDYFIKIKKDIERGLMARAEVLLRQRNIARYNALRDYYTKHLDGKYPFANYDKAQRVATDADIDAVREFFKMYEEFGGRPEKVLDQIYQLGDDAKALYEFMQKIHDLRLFFGNFLKSQYEVMKVNLEANFDVNKREEANTDYLVDKVFKPNNDAVIEPISQDKSGLWYFGEPIEFNFRWADGDEQANKPVADHNDPDLIIDGTTAKFQCVGSFAALRMLQKYRTDSVNAEQLAPNQMVLGFRIPLNNGKDAKVFVGITASVPKQPGEPSAATLRIPMPAGKMPEIPSSVTAVANEAVLVSKAISLPGESDAVIDQVILGADDPQSGQGIERKRKSTGSEKPKNTRPQPTAATEPESHDARTKNEIMDILKSNKPPETSDTDTLVEVAEEPIG